jgi:hypothetical protein
MRRKPSPILQSVGGHDHATAYFSAGFANAPSGAMAVAKAEQNERSRRSGAAKTIAPNGADSGRAERRTANGHAPGETSQSPGVSIAI